MGKPSKRQGRRRITTSSRKNQQGLQKASTTAEANKLQLKKTSDNSSCIVAEANKGQPFHPQREQLQRLQDEFNNPSLSITSTQRLNAFVTYCGLLEQLDSKQYTHQDYIFLKTILKKTSQLQSESSADADNDNKYNLFYRVCSYMTLAGALCCNGHYDSQGQALQYYDDAIAICDALLANDNKKIMKQIINLHGMRTTMGTVLLGQRAMACDVIRRCSLPTACMTTTTTTTTTTKPNNESSTAPRRVVPLLAGLICDCCGQVRRQNTILSVCGRCKLAHYCSLDCQKMAWNELGHKHECRHQHEFRIGDVAAIIEPFGEIQTRAHVQIKELVQDDDATPSPLSSSQQQQQQQQQQQWVVVESINDDVADATTTSTTKNEQCNKKLKLCQIISTQRLRRVRPGLWKKNNKNKTNHQDQQVLQLADWEQTFEIENFSDIMPVLMKK